jgi:flagellum-specific peptidoglycan hydrolase FlgJ
MLSRQEYIDKYKNAAVNATKGTGLFASVLLTQGIVESNNGNSVLSSKYHNHFGIKADSSWKGPKVNMQTREVLNGADVTIGDYFRVYSNDEEGFRDRTNFLLRNPRYANAGVFTAKTPQEQIEALKRAGYATDPNYVSILTGVLERYNLSAIDRIIEVTKKNIGFVILGAILLLLSIIALYFELYKNKSVVKELQKTL